MRSAGRWTWAVRSAATPTATPTWAKWTRLPSQADQAAADAIFQEVLGTTPTLLRPPYGSMNKTLKTTCGRCIVTWSIDTEDWLSKDADKDGGQRPERREPGAAR